MLPTFAEEKCAYELAQNLELVTRETARVPPVTTKAAQQGFLFYESKVKPPRAMRVVTENLLSAQSLAKLRKLEQAPRKGYFQEHSDLYFSIAKPFGLELPMEFATDIQGGFAAPTVEGQPSPRPMSMPYEIAHFPLVTPAISGDDPVVEKTWKSAIKVRCGFGHFTLPYTGKWAAKDLVHATAQIAFDPPTGQEKPAVFNDVKLEFKAQGSWTVAFRLLDGAPDRAKGQVNYVAVATPPGGQPTEVLNAKLDFKWRKVPLGFTQQLMIPAAWAQMPAAFEG